MPKHTFPRALSAQQHPRRWRAHERRVHTGIDSSGSEKVEQASPGTPESLFI